MADSQIESGNKLQAESHFRWMAKRKSLEGMHRKWLDVGGCVYANPECCLFLFSGADNR